jgi:hypothetical protein
MDEPVRISARAESAELILVKQSVLIDPDARLWCRIETELPRAKASIAERCVIEPKATRPSTERPELTRTKARTLRLLPKAKESKNDTLLPLWILSPRTEIELQMFT